MGVLPEVFVAYEVVVAVEAEVLRQSMTKIPGCQPSLQFEASHLNSRLWPSPSGNGRVPANVRPVLWRRLIPKRNRSSRKLPRKLSTKRRWLLFQSRRASSRHPALLNSQARLFHSNRLKVASVSSLRTRKMPFSVALMVVVTATATVKTIARSPLARSKLRSRTTNRNESQFLHRLHRLYERLLSLNGL